MSNFNLAKRLSKPAEKAWKRIKNQFLPKLCDPKLFVKAITILGRYCKIGWRSVSILIQRKIRNLTNRTSRSHLHHHHDQLHRSISSIYVDELFPDPTTMELREAKENMVESSSDTSITKSRHGLKTKSENNVEKVPKQLGDKQRIGFSGEFEKGLDSRKEKAKADETSRSCATPNKWKIPSLPQFRGIDERAEEFIAKFRQDVKLEREQSIIEFQEMLKRSA